MRHTVTDPDSWHAARASVSVDMTMVMEHIEVNTGNAYKDYSRGTGRTNLMGGRQCGNYGRETVARTEKKRQPPNWLDCSQKCLMRLDWDPRGSALRHRHWLILKLVYGFCLGVAQHDDSHCLTLPTRSEPSIPMLLRTQS